MDKGMTFYFEKVRKSMPLLLRGRVSQTDNTEVDQQDKPEPCGFTL